MIFVATCFRSDATVGLGYRLVDFREQAIVMVYCVSITTDDSTTSRQHESILDWDLKLLMCARVQRQVTSYSINTRLVILLDLKSIRNTIIDWGKSFCYYQILRTVISSLL